MGLLIGLAPMPTQAATPEEIEESIQNGLDCLVPQQKDDGSWGDWEKVAKTAFAVVKLEERAIELGYGSPFNPEYPYSENVKKGLDYIFKHAATYGPDTGVCFDQGNHETYSTGIVMMAIAGSREPGRSVNVLGSIVDGKTYKEVLQGNVDFFAWSQNPDGGWRYWAHNEPSDNSNTGYAVLGLRYAEAPSYGFECNIPPTLKNNLSDYIDYIQCDTNGGSGYTSPCNWVNLLKTGNLLFEMSFVGDDISSPRVQNAIAYIQNTWNDPSGDPGWRPHHYQAMYCLMKGFGSFNIDTITVGVSDVDWFEEFATAILLSQEDDGCWPPDNWGDKILSTEWALLTLEKVAPPPPVNLEVELPECACDDAGYNVTVTYTVERFLVDGTVKIYENGNLVHTVNLTDFMGTASYTHTLASDTEGTHTWKAELDVEPSGGGTPSHREDEASLKVCETPEVLDIPDQMTPFEAFDLDDYLSYSGSLEIAWSATVPDGWTVEIDEENIATVTSPEGATDPAVVAFNASIECCDSVICSDSDEATFTPNQPPDCSEAYPSIQEIWPPNHKYVDIEIMGVTDPDGDPVTITNRDHPG
jgi:hypothetical protein